MGTLAGEECAVAWIVKLEDAHDGIDRRPVICNRCNEGSQL